MNDMSDAERAVDALLRDAHLAAPHEVPSLIAQHAATMGAYEAVVYLADLQQLVLVPFMGSTGPGTGRQLDSLVIDSTLAGRAYQLLEVLTQPAASGTRVWLPLLNGSERLGVLRVDVHHPKALDADDRLTAMRLRRFASLVADVIVTKTLYGDTIVKTRRRAQMGLAAEIQWGLLPPLTFGCEQVIVAGALEPAYEVAGDSVDYAVDSRCARVAVFDGMGHGMQSAQLATLSVAAYRNARRADRSLTDTARLIDEAIQEFYIGDTFVTAVLAELNTDTGELSWVNAGHPEPLLLRGARLTKTLRVAPGLPLGLGLSLNPGPYQVGSEGLQRGDRVLFYTDGVTETRSPDGEFFGLQRLVDLLTRNFAADLPAPETMRRVTRALLEHQQGQLSDDATMLLIEWHSNTQQRPLP